MTFSNRIFEIKLEYDGKTTFSFPEKGQKDSKYIKNYSRSFFTGEHTCAVSAKFYLLRPSSIYRYGKTSFLIILGVTVITLLLIVFDSSKNENEDSDEKDGELDAENTEASENLDAYGSSEDVKEDSDSQDEEKTDLLEEGEVSDDASLESSDSEKNLSDASTEDFKALLSEKINDAISNEREFAVFFIKLSGLEKDSEEYKKIAELLEERLKAKNLIFEGKENMLIILKEETSLDENLTLAENTINEIENTFKEKNFSLYGGLSNRNMRIVTGERLLFEAEAALNHAEETAEKVIAFRANTEQYNNFINQQAD